jgi:hypothetical protein
MKIDTEHLHYWMQAIRNSENPMRTMDAFWSGQLKSKEWLIESLSMHCSIKSGPYDVDIYGGWVGVLASMLFQSTIPLWKIRSIDIDHTCESIANIMNKGEEMQGRFSAITADMCDTPSEANIIINTSCEHVTQAQYNRWLNLIPNDSLLVLQSNNYNIPEHVRIANSLDEFKSQSNIDIIWAGELELPLYTRWMIIGTKNV